MRTLKENFFDNLGIGKKAKIEEWLKKYDIKNYTINSDFTIDVKGDVNLKNYPDKELPEYIQFNIVEEQFDLSNSNITSLKGAPKKCYSIDCTRCYDLISLEYCPEVTGSIYITFCNKLSSLEGCPKKCTNFYCGQTSIKNLVGAPEYIKGDCNIGNNEQLTSLKGAPKECRFFNCDNNKNLTSLKGAPKKCEFFKCNGCSSIQNLVGITKNVKTIYCQNCTNLTSLKGAPKECEVFNCDGCNIKTLEDCTLKKCNKFSYFLFYRNFTKDYVLKYIDAQHITL